VNSPYTTQPADALMAAQTSVGLALGAMIWARRLRPWPAMALLLLAIAIAVASPVEADFLHGMGMTLGPDHEKNVLKLAAAAATVGALVSRQWRFALVAVLGEGALWETTNYIKDCNTELAAAHLAFFGLLFGIYRSAGASVAGDREGRAAEPLEAYRPVTLDDLTREDALALGAGTLAGCVACWLVLHFHTNSGDEWGYTFQAALFARFRAYGTLPHCSEAFRSFWVMQYMGRSFAEYTPGWPYFMTPFMLVGAPWLAGPASLGLLAAGVGRLGRRAAAGFAPGGPRPSPSLVRASGWFAVMTLLVSSTVLINGASRYPHVFVAATFAWALEALCVICRGGGAADSADPLPLRLRSKWGAILGASVALCAAARPQDGVALSLGFLFYFGYAVARRRVSWRATWVALAVGGGVVMLTLVVLRLQLGIWFKTGYSLAEATYTWDKAGWSLPEANEYKWGIPLSTGAYCWFPCAPAVGLAGLGLLRGRARRLCFVFFVGAIALLTLYTLQERGRGLDFGYGPRYQLPLVVPMAVGAGVVFGHLWARARAAGGSALALGGPVALALASVGIGVVRIAPLIYPHTYADVHDHNRLHDAIDASSLRHAIVLGGVGLNNTDPMDLTENLPLELYDQDVLIAIDRGPDESRCVREKYKGRSFYLAIPGDPVRIIRY
jgi:hypothetical protein